jgi:hypothetical protein
MHIVLNRPVRRACAGCHHGNTYTANVKDIARRASRLYWMFQSGTLDAGSSSNTSPKVRLLLVWRRRVILRPAGQFRDILRDIHGARGQHTHA